MILFSLPWAKAEGSYVPFDWNLFTFVDTHDGYDSETITDVVSPYQHTSYATVNGNWAQAVYDFYFEPAACLGTFDIDAGLHIDGDPEVRSLVSGEVFVTPGEGDLPIHIAGSLVYQHAPGDDVDVYFRFLVIEWVQPFPPPLFFASLHGGNLTGQPAAGTLAYGGDRVLLAGHTYLIEWTARIDTLAELNPAGPVNASGYIHFSFIPEPSALFGVACAGLLLARRRRLR